MESRPGKIEDVALPAGRRREQILRWIFGAVLLARLFFPFFDSPLDHLSSDPARHWNNGAHFLHPDVMGGIDPFLYQLWLFILHQSNAGSPPGILFGTGYLCALMPYGWYRALRELLPNSWALAGGIVIGLMPNFTAIYGYFMNETLLLTLTGFAVWFSLRAMRLKNTPAFALACLFWLLAGFTRSVALPMGAGTLGFIWLTQRNKAFNAAVGVALLTAFVLPAGLHARQAIHYFAPFGNFYFNDIYRESGKKIIVVDYGQQGHYAFTCPSFVMPVFYPFSDWATDRIGKAFIKIDTTNGRADWIAEEKRIADRNMFPFWKDMQENFVNLCLGQNWPDNERSIFIDRINLWMRWLWPPLILLVAYGAVARRFRAREWLLPAIGLGMFLFLMVQRDAIMEGRYRKPIDPFYVASAVVLAYRWRCGSNHDVAPTSLAKVAKNSSA